MSLTEFAMVEELAFLIKDNLPCKHLILSMEGALVSFLQGDTSSNGVLELEPMNPYNRLLLHRLADIFGFSHQSIGEGEDRHLVLERCPETSIPSILISDLLWQYDQFQSPKMVDAILRRKEGSEGAKEEDKPIFSISLEEREQAYLAARERIFSIDDLGETRQHMKDRPRHDPMVARRMIAHALGQRSKPSNLEIHSSNAEQREEQVKNVKMSPGNHSDSSGKLKTSKLKGSESPHSEKRTPKNTNSLGSSSLEKNEGKVNRESIRQEHVGAARRIFANALGFKRDGNLPK